MSFALTRTNIALVSVALAVLLFSVVSVTSSSMVYGSTGGQFSIDSYFDQKSSCLNDLKDAQLISIASHARASLSPTQRAALPTLTDHQVVAIARKTDEGRQIVSTFSSSQKTAVNALLGNIDTKEFSTCSLWGPSGNGCVTPPTGSCTTTGQRFCLDGNDLTHGPACAWKCTGTPPTPTLVLACSTNTCGSTEDC